LEIALLEGIMQKTINLFLGKGYSLYWILTDILNIDFLDIREIEQSNGEEYMKFLVSPYFILDKVIDKITSID